MCLAQGFKVGIWVLDIHFVMTKEKVRKRERRNSEPKERENKKLKTEVLNIFAWRTHVKRYHEL